MNDLNEAYERIVQRIEEKEFQGRAGVPKFREVLEEEYGTANYTKRDKMWNLAWEWGHSNGWYEVLLYYADIVEVIGG